MTMSARDLAVYERLDRALARALDARVVVPNVDRKPGKCGGRPCIVDSRISVLRVWVNFLEGQSFKTMAEWWPGVTEQQLEDAVRALRPAMRFAKNPARTARTARRRAA